MTRSRPSHSFLIAVIAAAFASPAAGQAQIGPSGRLGGLLERAAQRTLSRIQERNDVFVDHSRWEDPWIVATDHFEVHTTHSRALGQEVALGLETMLGHFRTVLATDYAPATPAKVFLLPEIQAYNAFGEEHGEYHSSLYGAFYARPHPEHPIVAVYDPNHLWMKMQLTHAALHQWLDGAFPSTGAPTWVTEGLSSYFTCYWDNAWAVGEFERLRDAGQLLPLERLLGDGIDRYGDRTHERMIGLATLFYYLLHIREDTRTVAAAAGEPATAAPFRDSLIAALKGDEADTDVTRRLRDDMEGLERAYRAAAYPK